MFWTHKNKNLNFPVHIKFWKIWGNVNVQAGGVLFRALYVTSNTPKFPFSWWKLYHGSNKAFGGYHFHFSIANINIEVSKFSFFLNEMYCIEDKKICNWYLFKVVDMVEEVVVTSHMQWQGMLEHNILGQKNHSRLLSKKC